MRQIKNSGETYIQARIRRALLTAPTLTRTLQSCRAIVHFGPWRHAVRAIIRMARPPQKEPPEGLSLLQIDSVQLVKAIRSDGVVRAGALPSDALARVRAITDRLPPGEYGEFFDIPDVRALIECAAVVRVAREYLQAEPVLLECNLVVAHAENPDVPAGKGSQREFHFDYAGWHSLNLFVYLTDVSAESGAHQVVAGTHDARTFWDAVRVAIPDREISLRFPNRTLTITGAAGTMFFEDTSAFHRRRIHTKRRVMLNILWASHRSWLSKGRLVPKYSDILRSSYPHSQLNNRL